MATASYNKTKTEGDKIPDNKSGKNDTGKIQSDMLESEKDEVKRAEKTTAKHVQKNK